MENSDSAFAFEALAFDVASDDFDDVGFFHAVDGELQAPFAGLGYGRAGR